MTATLVSLALMQDDGGGAWQCTPTFALLKVITSFSYCSAQICGELVI